MFAADRLIVMGLRGPKLCPFFHKHGGEVMEFIFGLIILVADIWAIVQTIKSSETGGIKILWVVVILLLPVIGLILWFFLGPKKVGA